MATTSGSRRAASSEAISKVAIRATSETASRDDPFVEDFSNEVMFGSYLYSKLPEAGVSPHIGTGGGLSLFDQLQSTAGRVRAVLFAFDLIQHDGEDQRARPLLERKKLLAKILARADGGIVYNDHLTESGGVVFAHACQLGAEGIVSKRIDSFYQSGPHPDWIKVKNPVAIALQRQRAERWKR